MFFRFALTLGLALGLFCPTTNAQDAITILPTDKTQPILSDGEPISVPWDTELQRSIRDSVRKLRESKSSDEKNALTLLLTKLLEQDYEARLTDYQKDLDQLEEKLKLMKQKLERKRNAKSDMVKLRIEVLKAEADDLGWPSPKTNEGPIPVLGGALLNPDDFVPHLTKPIEIQAPTYRKFAETNQLIDDVLAEHRKAWGKVVDSRVIVDGGTVEKLKNDALQNLPPFSELTSRQVKRINFQLQYPKANDQSETDERISEALTYRRQEWDRLKEEGPTTTMEKVIAIREKTLSMTPPFSELTPKQIRTITSSGVLQSGPARAEAISELEKYVDDSSLDGAFAAYQLFEFAVDYPMEGWPENESKAERIAKQRVCFERFLNHPNRNLLLEVAPKLHLFFNIRQFDSPETWKKYKTEMFGLYHSFLEDQLASRTDLTDCLVVLQTIADESEREEVTKYGRLKLIEHGNMSLFELEAEESPYNDIEIQRLKGEILQLEKLSDTGTLIGTEATPLKVLWSSSERLASWSNLSGKTSVLYFSTPSCGPCVKSVPKLINIRKQISKDTNFVGVTSQQGSVPLKRGNIDCTDNLKRECELLNEYIADSKINWPILVTKESVFNGAYGVRSIPHMVVLDSKGTIRDMFNPYLEDEASILKRIAAVEAN